MAQIKAAVEMNALNDVVTADTLVLQAAIQQSEQHHFIQGFIKAHQYLGDYFIRKNHSLKAISHYQTALKKIQLLEDEYWESTFYLNQRIANVYHSMGRFRESKERHEILLNKLDHVPSYFSSKKVLELRRMTVQNVGSNALHMGELDHAISYLLQAKEIDSKEIYDNEEERLASDMMLILNLGAAYLFKGDGKSAKPYVEEHLAYMIGERKNLKETAKSYGNLAYCEFLLKNYENAYKNYEKSIAISEENGYSDVTMITYKDLSDTYKAQGRFAPAITYLDKYYVLKDSIQGTKVQQNIDALRVQHESDINEQQIIQLNQKNKIIRQEKILFTATLVFVLLGALFLAGYLFYVNRKGKQNALVRKLELKNTQQELSFKKQDITRMALEISKKQELADDLLIKIKQIEPFINLKGQKEWKALSQYIRENLQSSEEQKILNQNVEEINNSFYNQLSETYPNLSKSEKELCSYIRLGLSNKEISAIRNVSPEAIRSGRFRLRKKLNLDSKEDVEAFLERL